MARLFIIGLAFALAMCGATHVANSQSNPGFNPDLSWCNTQGSFAIRGPVKWQCLLPGTAGQSLLSGGPGALPYWNTISGTGTVTSVNGSGGTTGLTLTGGPITGAGTLTLGGSLALANGGISPVGGANTVLKSNGSAASWGQIVNANITAGTITNSAINASAAIAPSKFATQPALTLLANITGGSAVPTAPTFTQALDAAFSSTQGSVLYRNVSGWSSLPPGTNGQALLTGGSGGNPSWQTIQGGNLGTQPNNTVLANISGSSATPTTPTVSQLLDSAIANVQGTLIYRAASGWMPIGPGTAGTFLQTNGGGIDPQWSVRGQYIGADTNNAATAGNIGEEIINTRQGGSAITGITTATDVASITLTAGDWDISAIGGNAPSSTSNVTSYGCSINNAANTFNSTVPFYSDMQSFNFTANGGRTMFPIPPIRVSLASSATYYLNCYVSGGGTTAGYGTIRARRMR